ncbi:hypothetical protein [Fusobacterium sp. MFO224]|uniref:hypothetical protein n=1 Tax=Fusobacterium sp. MFO224 TaxID=3378070 RepID=UPI0038541DAC
MQKKMFKTTMVMIFIFIILEGSIIFIIDPYQRYRKPFYNKTVYLDGYQLNQGILKNYKYTSLIVGSSMNENTLSKEADSYFEDETFINISVGGNKAKEIEKMIKFAKRKQVNKIILNIDYSYFYPNLEYKINDYLYSDNYLKDYKYLLNVDSFMQVLRIILKPQVNIYNSSFWGDDYKYGKEIILKNYGKNDFKSLKLKYESEKIVEKSKEIYMNTLNKIVEDNPNTKFYIFYPPYSMITYLIESKEEKFYKDLEIKEFVEKNLLEYKNVELYDFQVASEITHNLDNYKDYSHYSPKINSLMLEYMFKDKKYLVTKENYKKYIEDLKEQTNNFKNKLLTN